MPSAPAEPASLDELRARLAAIDRTLLLLIAERLRTAREAIALRRRDGGSPTDATQELRVLERSRRWARELGLRPDLAEAWVASLVGEGKRSGAPPVPGSAVTVYFEAPTRPAPGPTAVGSPASDVARAHRSKRVAPSR